MSIDLQEEKVERIGYYRFLLFNIGHCRGKAYMPC
jgi:hypothetical protein